MFVLLNLAVIAALIAIYLGAALDPIPHEPHCTATRKNQPPVAVQVYPGQQPSLHVDLPPPIGEPVTLTVVCR